MIVQFMLESLLMVAMAMIVALILVGLSLDIFNNFQEKLQFPIFLILRFIISFIAVGFLQD